MVSSTQANICQQFSPGKNNFSVERKSRFFSQHIFVSCLGLGAEVFENLHHTGVELGVVLIHRAIDCHRHFWKLCSVNQSCNSWTEDKHQNLSTKVKLEDFLKLAISASHSGIWICTGIFNSVANTLAVHMVFRETVMDEDTADTVETNKSHSPSLQVCSNVSHADDPSQLLSSNKKQFKAQTDRHKLAVPMDLSSQPSNILYNCHVYTEQYTELVPSKFLQPPSTYNFCRFTSSTKRKIINFFVLSKFVQKAKVTQHQRLPALQTTSHWSLSVPEENDGLSDFFSLCYQVEEETLLGLSRNPRLLF